MTHNCTLSVEGPSGKEDVTLTFEEEEWDLLGRAGEYARALKQAELIERGTWSTGLTIRWNREEGLSASATLPSDEEVIVVLHRLRPLILEGEPTYFNRVVNVIARRANSPEMRRGLEALKNLFAGGEFQSMVGIMVEGKAVNSEAMLKTWLNASEYHRDVDKQAEMAQLHEILPTEATRGIFLALVVEKLKAVRGLEILIDVLQGKQEGMRL
jgi:hypothetical protein